MRYAVCQSYKVLLYICDANELCPSIHMDLLQLAEVKLPARVTPYRVSIAPGRPPLLFTHTLLTSLHNVQSMRYHWSVSPRFLFESGADRWTMNE